jgi:hypothetical protein
MEKIRNDVVLYGNFPPPFGVNCFDVKSIGAILKFVEVNDQDPSCSI